MKLTELVASVTEAFDVNFTIHTSTCGDITIVNRKTSKLIDVELLDNKIITYVYPVIEVGEHYNNDCCEFDHELELYTCGAAIKFNKTFNLLEPNSIEKLSNWLLKINESN